MKNNCNVAESTKQSLEGEVKRNSVTAGEVTVLEEEMGHLKKNLNTVSTKLEKAHNDLTKEQAKNKSVAKHGQVGG